MLNNVSALVFAVVLMPTICTFLFVHRLKQDLFNSKLPRCSIPASFHPIFFFDEIFSLYEGKDYEEISELQDDVEALQAAKVSMRPKKPEGKVYSVSQSIRKLEKKYEACLEHYLDAPKDSEARKKKITQLKNKIELGHRTIEKEKDVFLSSNGEYVRSFIFNRQNQLTDILLTGISIPIFLEALKWETKGIGNFLTTLIGHPLMCFLAIALWIVFMYRIVKYHKNKYSMLKDMSWAAEYDRAELMLCVFECALKNVEDRIAA